MLNLIFELYEIKDLKKIFLRLNLITNIFQIFSTLLFFFIRNDFFTTITVFIFISLTTYLNLKLKFYENTLSFILIIITTFFINIPLIFILYLGIDYNYEIIIKELPFSQDIYAMLLPYSIIWLFFSWLAIYLGICLAGIKKLYVYKKRERGGGVEGNKKKQKSNNVFYYNKLNEINFSSIIFWSISVTFVSILSNKNFYNVFNYDFKQLIIFNYLNVFFMDEIFFFLLLILNLKISQRKDFNSNLKKYFLTTFILLFLFLISKIFAGSKGALLVALFHFFLNFVILSQFAKTKMIFFQRTFFFFLPILLVLLFSLGDFTRNYLRNYEIQTINDFFSLEKLKELLTIILYRISTSGTHQYILIFVSYINSIINLDTSISLLKYISHNLINLFTPGIPFPDYYSPSSQFLNDIVNYGNLYHLQLNYKELIKTLNTQPFPIWSFFLIIFNFFSFFFLFIFSFLITLMLKKKNLYLKIFILNIFFGIFFNYGFEYLLFSSVIAILNYIIVLHILFFLSKVFNKSTSYK